MPHIESVIFAVNLPIVGAKNKQLYRDLCARQKDIPLFMQPWWLDSCCPNGAWELCLCLDKGGNIRGALPYYQEKKWGMRRIKNPLLTPYMGVYFNYPQGLKEGNRRYAFEYKVLKDLLDQLPSVHYFSQSQCLHFSNYLPFYWANYRQTTRYTYLLDAPIQVNQVFSGMESAVRNKIRKAERLLEVVDSPDIQLFYEVNKKPFEHQQMDMPYSLDFLRNLDETLKERQQRRILLAKDQQEQIHAAIYLVWDHQYVYNLMLGTDPSLRNSGAAQLLLWQGIQWAEKQGLAFDFEGSMLEQLESVFKAFGARRQAYHHIYRYSSPWLELFKDVLKSRK